jgi:hypothetical protein
LDEVNVGLVADAVRRASGHVAADARVRGARW